MAGWIKGNSPAKEFVLSSELSETTEKQKNLRNRTEYNTVIVIFTGQQTFNYSSISFSSSDSKEHYFPVFQCSEKQATTHLEEGWKA